MRVPLFLAFHFCWAVFFLYRDGRVRWSYFSSLCWIACAGFFRVFILFGHSFPLVHWIDSSWMRLHERLRLRLLCPGWFFGLWVLLRGCCGENKRGGVLELKGTETSCVVLCWPRIVCIRSLFMYLGCLVFRRTHLVRHAFIACCICFICRLLRGIVEAYYVLSFVSVDSLPHVEELCE